MSEHLQTLSLHDQWLLESFDINFLYQVLPSDLFGGVLSDLPSDLHLGDQFIPFPSELSHAAVLDAKPAEKTDSTFSPGSLKDSEIET